MVQTIKLQHQDLTIYEVATFTILNNYAAKFEAMAAMATDPDLMKDLVQDTEGNKLNRFIEG